MKTRLSIIGGTLFLLVSNVNADVVLYDLQAEGGMQAWQKALAAQGKVEYGRFDLNKLWFKDIEGMDGPVGSDGNSSGSIPTGFITENIFMDSNVIPWGAGGRQGRGVGGEGLVALSVGDFEPHSALLANFFVDSFDVYSDPSITVTAVSFNTISLLGSNTVDLSVYLRSGESRRFISLDAQFDTGHHYGIIATDGDDISRFNLYDSAGGGAEGIIGETIFYTVPAVPTAALFLLSFSIKRRRRR